MICPHGHDEGLVERIATPNEVDAGCELGVAFDPCPDCQEAPGHDGHIWYEGYKEGQNSLLTIAEGVAALRAATGNLPPALVAKALAWAADNSDDALTNDEVVQLQRASFEVRQ